MSSDVLLIEDSSGAIKQAGSVNEYNFAIALEAEDIQFLYQFQLFGGHRSLGGVMVDFLAWSPFAIPIEIIGAYWHQNSTRERYRTAIIQANFSRDVVEVTEEESETVEAARSFIKRVIK